MGAIIYIGNITDMGATATDLYSGWLESQRAC